ncbi:hypothetical protein MGYG_03594 [Nannizzia gypsea CBS 118893]|uniref:Uncharacterized protein n=1 Tax=Arthroderma gypseum (strain ATCC MYA-4604 / CBS 118893) TaxID=535722 RepID=E4USS4_ARTGP|nr:hypothetical protein MGYG_03594 [Nannizzia gypsea CBS 118893]EFR00589.1 hypothetical protein MGYG_03594 [Nannizzia gypsea CBS 118893]
MQIYLFLLSKLYLTILHGRESLPLLAALLAFLAVTSLPTDFPRKSKVACQPPAFPLLVSSTSSLRPQLRNLNFTNITSFNVNFANIIDFDIGININNSLLSTPHRYQHLLLAGVGSMTSSTLAG